MLAFWLKQVSNILEIRNSIASMGIEMATLAEVLRALDGGIDGNFAASLAGLALAAAAFYSPTAQKIATEGQEKLEIKEDLLQ